MQAETASSSSSPTHKSPTSASDHQLLSPPRTNRRKETRVPSVTPRRFRRFFTPRSLQLAESDRPARVTLGSLDPAAINRRLQSPSSLADDNESLDGGFPSSPIEHLTVSEPRHAKRRRHSCHQAPPGAKRNRPAARLFACPENLSTSSTTQNAPSQIIADEAQQLVATDNGQRNSLSNFFRTSRAAPQALLGKPFLHLHDQTLGLSQDRLPLLKTYKPTPIRKLANRGFHAQLLNREHGFSAFPGQQHIAYPAADPLIETASFYSGSEDTYVCAPMGAAGRSFPFCLASCHWYPITAIGDDHGFVRFFDTRKSVRGRVPGGSDKVLAHHQFHENVVMDLDFSPDDSRLASASSDRSGKIMDMSTQTIAVNLDGGHLDSMRQVAFRPDGSSGHVIATSDRAGRVQIWDLRCSSLPSTCFSTLSHGGRRRDDTLDIWPARTVNTIDNAHRRKTSCSTSSASITTLRWLPGHQSHLILTGSEANASIKLWDTRFIKPRRQTEDMPLSVTAEPPTHKWRSYGITSMALSTDASRLYAVCKDNTVYAYSTAHLKLGSAPELSSGSIRHRPTAAEGLGPILGFRHDALRVSSFYVKCAVRPAINGEKELLAVGSSESCAVLFPTDDRYVRNVWSQRQHMPNNVSNSTLTTTTPPLTPCTSSTSFSSSLMSTVSSPPISRIGTALIRGHTREVTSLSWSCQGRLVSASDDFFVRHWQEDASRARHLRQVGEFGGERNLSGWAEVAEDWDGANDVGDMV
ncbi:hypothetical protein CDD82_2279 [Ophiocordyceps australis]|uniref:Anaphase-promoting complex subunit 4 WD40 domain-containing protein n=1 Tax=Ophiocordyceps australis TaxID=1399860 RepID=A0A2C5Y602_9HYPO|nr:hypothetical protein CDD82_2279 [Ophiocordyceps australis]